MNLIEGLRELANDMNCQPYAGDGYAAHIEARCPRCRLLALVAHPAGNLEDQVSILRTTCDAHIHTIEDMQLEIDELKAAHPVGLSGKGDK
jgi:phage FluMu protein Com